MDAVCMDIDRGGSLLVHGYMRGLSGKDGIN
uniref:Uncharacterized protein n=1 Tax=Arundo donax TaxID=35708 RepID=A0A0A9BHY2_ARUDO